MGHVRFEFISETSRETSESGSATHRFLLQFENPDDYHPLNADFYVLSNTYPMIAGLFPMVRKSITWTPLESLGPRYWLGFFVEVNYGVPEKGDSVLADRATARLVSRRFYGEDEVLKIDLAHRTIAYGISDTSEEEKERIKGYGNTINPSKDGPQGIEMPFTRFAWDEVWSVPRSKMIDEYVLSIPNLKNHTNNNAFRGFQENSVKLVDFTVEDHIPQNWEEFPNAVVEISFKFVVEPWEEIDREGVEKFTKKGWEYVSPVLREIINEDQKTSTFKIIAFRVQQVYEKADFDLLGIS